MSQLSGILTSGPIGFVHSRVALKVLIAAILGFLAVVVVLVYISIRAQTELTLTEEKAVLETQHRILMGQLEESEKLALSLATLTASRSDVESVFYDRNRRALAELTVPGFNALTPIVGASVESQFHVPRATSFLRLNDLEKHGDDLSAFRPTVVRVNTEKTPASGIEVGRYTAAVRGVAPIFFEDEHMGSVEFGQVLSDEYLANIQKQYNIRSAIFFDTSSPNLRAFFEAQPEKNTGPFSRFAASWGGAQKSGPPDALRQRVVKTGQSEVYEDVAGRQTIKLAPLKDFTGAAVGTVEIYLDRSAVLAQIAKSRNTAILAGAGLALVGALFILWLVNATVRRPVREISRVYEEVGLGNFDARAKIYAPDELGTMAASLNAMLDNTLSLIQTSEERDAMQASIMKLLEEISNLAEGDLTQRAEVTEDFTGAIADAFNDMVEQLTNVVRDVKEATLHVSSTSQEVSKSTESLAESSEMQAVQVSDAIAAINEMAASIQQVAENAAQSAQVSEQSVKHANEGATSVQATNSAMEAIRERVQETARAIKRLGESSQEVGNIVQLINDIADRTSILALNASIQAAMAGDAGRGFAVVAEEVQRLAERSTNATKQIETLIKNIQGEINEAGASMEESIQKVVDGSKLAQEARGKLQEIEGVSKDLGDLIQAISMASKQQARASENIAKTMEEVGEVSGQTSAASRQTAVSMQNMAEIADKLRVSVAAFKLGRVEGLEDK